MMALARALSFWINVRSARAFLLDQREVRARLLRHVLLHLQQLGEAEDRLQRVVQLVRNAGHQHANRGQALLANHLLLQ